MKVLTSSASTAAYGNYSLGFSGPLVADAIAYSGDGTVEIEGERFNLEYEDGMVVITHPQWSLLGVGSTRAEARDRMREEAAALVRIMANDTVYTLSPQAARLRAFAKRLSR